MPKYLKLQVKLATMLVCIYNELWVVRRVHVFGGVNHFRPNISLIILISVWRTILMI